MDPGLSIISREECASHICLSRVAILSSAPASMSLFQEDFDVTAFACAPVPYMLTALFCGNDVTCPPNYIVYSKNVRETPAINNQLTH